MEIQGSILQAEDVFQEMIGRSACMKEIFAKISLVAATDSTVLITGESGTGKELVAKAIHHLSIRQNERMISVNCGAIPAELLESELFGHMKGSFTGALFDRKGKFELADKGTIFLDEIGDMPAPLQVKILRVLQNKQVEPVGSMETLNVDVRVIAATNRNLSALVENRSFREDLYYRLNVIPIRIPSLREHREDIPLLISYFLNKFQKQKGSNSVGLAPKVWDLLINYDWPGNIRELENLMERLVVLKAGTMVRPEDLPHVIQETITTNSWSIPLPQDGIDLKSFISQMEDGLILQALDRTNGNKNKASQLLQMNRTTLVEKMKKKGLQRDSNQTEVNESELITDQPS